VGTHRVGQFIVKGFTLDDERLKQGGTRNEYFDELLQRIREIRLSERNFYRKICDIYRTSVDYDPAVEMPQRFCVPPSFNPRRPRNPRLVLSVVGE